MTDMKQVYDFAVKWCNKFKDPRTDYRELTDRYMSDDCDALGFDMDCGRSFRARYGESAISYETFIVIIDDVDDILLLGSAIYSHWRFYNHWAYSGREILEPRNRSWFILALSRLSVLAGENLFCFEGLPSKIRIVSNNICFGPMPEPNDEVEHSITINADGEVSFSAYALDDSFEGRKKLRNMSFRIEKPAADNLLNSAASFFKAGYHDNEHPTDCGFWFIELTDTDGNTIRFSGYLGASLEVDGTDLSDLVRDSLKLYDLFVFDGNPDIINRIAVDYHRVTKDPTESVIEDYTERLVIDRESNNIEHIQKMASGFTASHKYTIESGIEILLDNLHTEFLYISTSNTFSGIAETSSETKDYTITVDFKNHPQQVITGIYYKHGLPEAWGCFAEMVLEFIKSYGFGEILNSSVYGKTCRRRNEYIFCSVRFDKGYRSYYYITDDESIEIDDFVLVPVGNYGHISVGKVLNIEYFEKEHAPLPIDKTKYIIRKCGEDEHVHYEE